MNNSDITVDDYINNLPEDRRLALESVRRVILSNIPKGCVETMTWGMPTFEVPLETFADTYNKKPLMYAALANQKNYMAVYLTSLYTDEYSLEKFVESYKASGKKLDMGKSCVRFKTLDDLPLELIGKQIKSTSVQQFVAMYKSVQSKK